jgi:hypothetical protein
VRIVKKCRMVLASSRSLVTIDPLVQSEPCLRGGTADMSRFSYRDQVVTPASPADCTDVVLGTLGDLGAGPLSVGSSIVGSLGSQTKIRLFGSTFGSRSWLPVKITVDVLDEDSHRVISIDVAEDFGVGTLTGAEGKFRARCQQVLVQVVEGVRSRLPATSPQQPVATSSPPERL